MVGDQAKGETVEIPLRPTVDDIQIDRQSGRSMSSGCASPARINSTSAVASNRMSVSKSVILGRSRRSFQRGGKLLELLKLKESLFDG